MRHQRSDFEPAVAFELEQLRATATPTDFHNVNWGHMPGIQYHLYPHPSKMYQERISTGKRRPLRRVIPDAQAGDAQALQSEEEDLAQALLTNAKFNNVSLSLAS